MPVYMIQWAYTAEAWSNMSDDGGGASIQQFQRLLTTMSERTASPVALTQAWLAFGDHDVVAVFAAPDNATAAAISIALSKGGGVKSVKTTPLIEPDSEGVRALKLAKGMMYRPQRP